MKHKVPPTSAVPRPASRYRVAKAQIRMSAQSKVLFSVARADDDAALFTIVPFVDGVSLITLVDAFERARSFEPVGGYRGIAPTLFDFGPLDRYLLGQFGGDSYWAKIGVIYLLGCECGEVGCWPLQCHVQVTDQQVTWGQFMQPHRPERDYSGFGPFEFNPIQYREAIALLQSDLANTASGR